MTTITLEIAIILVLTLVKGVFAMSEVAMLSARRSRLQRLAEHGDRRAHRALLLLEDPNNFLSTAQIGVILVGVLSGAFGGATIAEKIAAYLSCYSVIAPYSESIGISIVGGERGASGTGRAGERGERDRRGVSRHLALTRQPADSDR